MNSCKRSKNNWIVYQINIKNREYTHFKSKYNFILTLNSDTSIYDDVYDIYIYDIKSKSYRIIVYTYIYLTY